MNQVDAIMLLDIGLNTVVVLWIAFSLSNLEVVGSMPGWYICLPVMLVTNVHPVVIRQTTHRV